MTSITSAETANNSHTPPNVNNTPPTPNTHCTTHTETAHTTPTQTPTTPNNGYAQLPLPTLRPTDIRLISHNINTLHTTTEAEIATTLDFYREFDPTIIGLQETNKNWTIFEKTEGPLRKVTQQRWPGARIVTAHSRDKAFHGPHQPGGVAQIVLRQLTGRVTSHGKDALGRYAWQEILLDGTHKLIVITAYRVSQLSATGAGPETSVMQQWRRLRAQGIENPNPRQQMLDDLLTFAKTHEGAGNEVIIMMDANARIDDPDIDKFMDELNMYDLMADYLPDTQPPTYQRGQHKIDHIIGTIGVLTAMTGAGILPFGEGPRSDHAIIYVDLSLETLSGMTSQSLHDPTHPSSRRLWSTDIKATEKYITLVNAGFQYENIAARTATLID